MELKYDIVVQCKGGGLSSQSQAILRFKNLLKLKFILYYYIYQSIF